MKAPKQKRKPIHVTIPENLVEYIDQYAEEHMMHRSSVVTQMILQHYKQAEQKGEAQ